MEIQEFEYKNDSEAAIKKLRQLCKEKGCKEVGVRMQTDMWDSVSVHIPIKYACKYINAVASDVNEHRKWEWVQSADLKINISTSRFFVYAKASCEATRIPKDEEE